MNLTGMRLLATVINANCVAKQSYDIRDINFFRAEIREFVS